MLDQVGDAVDEGAGLARARGGEHEHGAIGRGRGGALFGIDYKAKTLEIDGVKLQEGDFISLNGTNGSNTRATATQTTAISFCSGISATRPCRSSTCAPGNRQEPYIAETM